MEAYIKCRYKSRWVEIWEEPLPCEQCLQNLINGSNEWVKPIDDIHHISPWAKTRQYKKDWTTLLGLCRTHHISQHWDNGWKSISLLLAIAKESIIMFNRMECKEKLRALVEFLHHKHIDDKINWVHKKTN